MSVNLLDLDGEGLVAFVAGLEEKPFRARQVKRWMHRLGESDFARMSDVAKSLREKLARTACISPPRIVSDSLARDGTRKWLLDVGKGNAVDTVFIPETNRGTLCISTQAGCTLACQFCSTGRQGFNRNLSVSEIIGQLWLANRELGATPGGGRVISNVVLMGMGEPRLNFDNTEEHARQLIDLVSRVPCKINLIPFNPFPNSGFVRSPRRVIERFGELLGAAGIVTTTRKTRGDEIDAACGQLAGKIHDRTRRSARLEGTGS